MKEYKLHFLFILAVVIVIGIQVYAAGTTNVAVLDPNRHPAKDGANCDVTTTSRVTIGNQASTRVVATSTQRAFARISIGDLATNTVSFSFNEDAAATLNSGLLIGLSQAGFTGSTSTPAVDFGITTVFPYTGSVTAITDNGTTTVAVTECVYS